MKLFAFPLLAALSQLALADIKFTKPAAGASLVGGGAISVEWTDSGSPAFTTYTLSLCAGGSTDGAWVSTPCGQV